MMKVSQGLHWQWAKALNKLTKNFARMQESTTGNSGTKCH